MELNFFYAKKGQYGKITLNAEELDFTINYSEINRYRPTAADPSCFGWGPVTGVGLKQTLPRYYGTITHRATYNSLPSSLVSKINKFSGKNTYALDRSANFIDKDQLGRYTGIDLYVQGDEGKKKVCNFQWAVVEEDDPQHPGQKILTSFYAGLYSFLCPNPDGELPENSAVGTLSNIQGVARYSADLKIALWIITVHDDVSGSPTYGQDFKVLVEAFSQPTGFPSTGVIMADMRCLTGVENSSNVINGSDPKKNSTPTGWGGKRDVRSSSDTITTIPAGMDYTVNWGDHGIFLYWTSSSMLSNLSNLLWSNKLSQVIKNTMFSPATGIISLHKLPITPRAESVGSPELITICGTVASGVTQKYSSMGGAIQEAPEELVEAYGVKVPRGWQLECLKDIYVEPFFNSFLDFEPYTTVSVRLPFIGTVAIPTSSCMGGYIRTNYLVDCLNGNCVAQIYTQSMRNLQNSEDGAGGWQLIGQYSGNCSLPMSITGNTMGGQVQVGAITGFASNAAGSMIRGLTGDIKGAVGGIASSAIDTALSTATAPRQTQVIGSLSANTTPMTDLTCRVMITRPWDVVPGEWEVVSGERVFSSDALLNQAGLESFSGGKVGTYEGMTKGLIRGSIDGATEVEMNEIRAAFAGGVIV